MRKPYVAADYRGRDKMTLQEFIEDVEKCHFRTQYDTGANLNALFIWNIVRNRAGLDSLDYDDLIHRYAELEGIPYEEMKARHDEYMEEKKAKRGKV